MRLVIVMIVFALVVGVPSSYAATADGLGKVYKTGKRKGERIPTTVQRENAYFEELNKRLDLLQVSLKESNTLLQKVVEEQNKSTDRLAKALGVIAKLIKQNNDLVKAQPKKK